MYARGTITGITRGTRKEHIIRAALESIAYQSKDVFDAMVSDAGTGIKELRVDGGVSNSRFVMQFQADLLGVPVIRPKNTETTALGAALLAGLGVGLWDSVDEIRDMLAVDTVFTPKMDEEQRSRLYETWKKAVERSKNWETNP
jgi:glycerol kinase